MSAVERGRARGFAARWRAGGFSFGGSQVAMVLAVAALAYRFVNFDLVPFILDEPAFLRAARAQVQSGVWAVYSPLVGNQGLHYGPTPLWFYGIVHQLFGARPFVHIAAMASCITLAHLVVSLSIGRAFQGGRLLAAALIGFLASSPYQFLWSRLAWDQSVNVLSALAIALCCKRGRIGVRRASALGVVLGLAIGSHLMVLPLVAVVYGMLFVQAVRARSPWALFAAAACTLAVDWRYLGYLLSTRQPVPEGAGLSWRAVRAVVLEPVRVATAHGIGYFFDHQWSQFAREHRTAAAIASLELVPWVLACATALGLITTLWRGRSVRARLAWMAIATWSGYTLLYAQRGLEMHPHYQFATWWVVLVGVAGLLVGLPRHGRAVRAMLGVLTALTLAQLVFVFSWMAFIRAHGGTMGPHYGAALAQQSRAIRRACEATINSSVVVNETAVFSDSLTYLADTERECIGKHLHIQPPPAPPAALRLRYREPGSAFLTVGQRE